MRGGAGRTPAVSGRSRGSAALLAALVVAAGGTALGQAQTGQAPYSADQAQTGEALYLQQCASCHLTDLRGQFEAPELAGPNFRNIWGNRSVADLLTVIDETMPVQAPGSLSEEQRSAIVAFILRENGVAPSGTRLTVASAGMVRPDGRAATVRAEDVRPPAPGVLGTGPSPDSIDRPPEVVGDVSETPTGVTRTYRRAERFTPVRDADLADPPGRDWLHWRGNPGAWGYSPLDQIDAGNVHRLQLAWSWGMEQGRSQQAPLVRDGVLYLSNPANVIQALDGIDGTPLWEYRRTFPGRPARRAAPNPRGLGGPDLRGDQRRPPGSAGRTHRSRAVGDPGGRRRASATGTRPVPS